ncbi:MAG TPA: GNAT family N-acetyltransferase [Fimbriimonadaceae bacterium]|nr:GNAT family N-acetyltransferase [Fimbriimonadaceae bacterium]
MLLDAATDVFCEGIAFVRNIFHPYEFVRIGDLRVMRDAEPKRDPRGQEIVVCGLEPAEALRQIERYDPPRYAVCVAVGQGEDDRPVRSAYKEAGYRLATTEDYFVRDLSVPLPDSTVEVRLVMNEVELDRLNKATRVRQILPEHLANKQVRAYWVEAGGSPIGWVRSIQVRPGATWVAGLYVQAEHRRRGYGRSLMARMLRDDREAGMEQSVLLASHTGAKLYPLLGYERIGGLLVFTKRR